MKTQRTPEEVAWAVQDVILEQYRKDRTPYTTHDTKIMYMVAVLAIREDRYGSLLAGTEEG